MAEKTEFLPTTSRYKDTPILEDADGNVFFDLWVEPPDVAGDRGTLQSYVVAGHEVGRLDLVANTFFNSVHAWWAIALVNGIRDQVEDLEPKDGEPNKTITIPRRIAVQNFLGR